VEATPSSAQNHQVPWLLHKAKTIGSLGKDVIRAHGEASMRGTRDVITGLASRVHGLRQRHDRPMRISNSRPPCP
jgi:hypothetical protein